MLVVSGQTRMDKNLVRQAAKQMHISFFVLETKGSFHIVKYH